MKTILKFFGRLCLVLIILVITTNAVSLAISPGKDYTKEYTIYKDVLDMCTLSDITQYLDDNNISYSISKNTLELTDYDNIKYLINSDNVSGRVIHSNLLHGISNLDAKDHDVISIETIIFNNEKTEKIFFQKGLLTYSKINDNYYINATVIYKGMTILGLIYTTLTFISLSIDIVDAIFEYIKKKQNLKKISDPSNK